MVGTEIKTWKKDNGKNPPLAFMAEKWQPLFSSVLSLILEEFGE